MLNRLKKNDKKGFTLVELIVVLVILAILAALLIPALTGYIDKAKEKQIIAETRQAVMAAQTLVDEVYATKSAGTEIKVGNTNNDDVSFEQIQTLAEIPGTVSAVTIDNTETPANSGVYKMSVSTLTYTSNGKKCVYSTADEDTFTVSKAN